MRLSYHNLFVLCLALLLGGGNVFVGDLRTTLKVVASSEPLPDEEEQRGKQVEELSAGATTMRRVKLRIGSPRQVSNTRCRLLPQSERCEPFSPPDSHSDLRNGIGAPLRC